MDWNELILGIFSIVFTALLGYLTPHIKKYLDIKNEAKYKQDLSDAALTAARLALVEGKAGEAAISFVKSLIRISAKDAIAVLNPGDYLNTIAASGIERAKNEAASRASRVEAAEIAAEVLDKAALEKIRR